MLGKLALAAAAATLCLVAVAASGAADTGTIVLRLATDPTPARTAWTYSGLGSTLALGNGTTSRASVVSAGTYTVQEAPVSPSGPPTLTGIACDDPTHNTRVRVASSSAVIAVAAGETVTCTFTHRALGPKPPASALALAQQFAPDLRLAAGERYQPLAIQDYLAATTLHSGTPPHGALLQAKPTLFTLPVDAAASYLDVSGAQPNTNAAQYVIVERAIEAKPATPTVYWKLVRQPSTGRIALEYWFLYLYNDFTDRHEADWEGVTVILQAGVPIGASFSQHQGRTWVPWGSAPVDRGPTVYVGRGSHANHPLPGSYRVRVCWVLAGRHCTTTLKSESARGDGDDLAPDRYQLHELGGVGYTGGWGSGTYIPAIGRTKDRVTDPRRRPDYSNPFAAVPAS
jgi:hypothetical protein